CVPDPRVRDVAVAGDLVAGVDHHHPLAEVIGEDPRHFPQHGRLADAGPAQQQDGPSRLDVVADDLDRPEYGSTDAACEPDHLASAIADGADAVQRSLDPGTVVVAEDADVVHDGGDPRLAGLAGAKHLL